MSHTNVSLAPRLALGISLGLNVLLAAVVAWKMGIAGARPRPAVPAAAEPPVVKLAEPPAVPTDYAITRMATARPALRYRGETGPAFSAWQQRAGQAFRQALAYAPRPFGGEVRLTERTEFPSFTRTKLYLRVESDLWLPAYLLVPHGAGKRPAMLAMPGHDQPGFQGAAAIAGRDLPQNYMRAFGLRLAEAGHVVLAVDPVGVGELNAAHYFRISNVGLMLGEPYKGLMLEQIHQALDYLASRSEVDPARIGTMGVSLGGELAMFTAALDPRVKFVVSSGFFGTYAGLGPRLMPSHYVPGLLRKLDLPDLVALVAPRPMLIQVGETDPIVPLQAARAAFTTLGRAYAAAGAEKAVTFEIHPGAHVMDVPPALAWLKRTVDGASGSSKPATTGHSGSK